MVERVRRYQGKITIDSDLLMHMIVSMDDKT